MRGDAPTENAVAVTLVIWFKSGKTAVAPSSTCVRDHVHAHVHTDLAREGMGKVGQLLSTDPLSAPHKTVFCAKADKVRCRKTRFSATVDEV
jgi:hypothetical protein